MMQTHANGMAVTAIDHGKVGYDHKDTLEVHSSLLYVVQRD